MAQTANSDRIDDLVGKVVEEYFQRSERGERPQLDEFVERYPEIGDLLKSVIPAVQAHRWRLVTASPVLGRHMVVLGKI